MSAFADPAPDLQLLDYSLPTVRADLLAIPVFEEDDRDADLAVASSTLGATLRLARATGEFRGKPFEMLLDRVDGWSSTRVLLIGCGAREAWTVERARRVASAAGLAARRHRAAHVAFALSGHAWAGLAQHAADGLTLAAFRSGRYKTDAPREDRLKTVTLVVDDVDDARAAAERGRVIGDCCNRARALADEPGNRLPPRLFAEHGVAALEGSGIRWDVLDEKGIAELGMGLLLGVGQASAEPPRLLVMRYEPEGSPAAPVLGLVGKGVTFDTGGFRSSRPRAWIA